MKYLLLVYREQAAWARLRPDERGALELASMAAEEELGRRGHLGIVLDVQASDPPLMVQARDHALAVTEGRCAAPGLALIRLCLLDARDLNEAIRIAGQLPYVQSGPIEVRLLLSPDERLAVGVPG